MKRFLVIAATVLLVASACQRQATQPLVVPVPPPVATPTAADTATKLAIPAAGAPTTKEAWIALGNDQMDAQRYAEAIIAYQKALELDPNNVDVRVDMGTCYRGVGQSEKALEEYRKGIAINPRHPNAWRNSGVVLSSDLHRNAEAIAAFQKYLEVFPGSPDAAVILGQISTLKAAK
ncbi:MAG: tetratricopeptide repeat protein [Spirochaetota bacterium]